MRKRCQAGCSENKDKALVLEEDDPQEHCPDETSSEESSAEQEDTE